MRRRKKAEADYLPEAIERAAGVFRYYAVDDDEVLKTLDADTAASVLVALAETLQACEEIISKLEDAADQEQAKKKRAKKDQSVLDEIATDLTRALNDE